MSFYNISFVAVRKYDRDNAEVDLKLISLQLLYKKIVSIFDPIFRYLSRVDSGLAPSSLRLLGLFFVLFIVLLDYLSPFDFSQYSHVQVNHMT